MSEWISAILAAFCIAGRYIGLVMLAMEIKLILLLLNGWRLP